MNVAGFVNKWIWIALIASFLFCCTVGGNTVTKLHTDRYTYQGLTYHNTVEVFDWDPPTVGLSVQRSDGARIAICAEARTYDTDEHGGPVNVAWVQVEPATQDGQPIPDSLAAFYLDNSDAVYEVIRDEDTQRAARLAEWQDDSAWPDLYERRWR